MRKTVAVLLLLSAPALAGTDLAAKYPATLDFGENAPPHDWTCGPEDVWTIEGGRLFRNEKSSMKICGRTIIASIHSETDPSR